MSNPTPEERTKVIMDRLSMYLPSALEAAIIAAIREAVAVEREACAAKAGEYFPGQYIAEAIRHRGKT